MLTEKLLPTYRNVIHKIHHPTGRTRDARSWRKAFKKEWLRLSTRATAPPDEFPYIGYNPDPHRWHCSCPAFVRSRFLICKHLIQACHPVNPRFFLKAERNRSLPFWKHPLLIPFTGEDGAELPKSAGVQEDASDCEFSAAGSDNDSNDGFDDELPAALTARFESDMKKHAKTIADVAPLLLYQIQFGESRFLQDMEREAGRGLAYFAGLLQVERAENTMGSVKPTTWNRSPGSMFLFTRPPSGS